MIIAAQHNTADNDHFRHSEISIRASAPVLSIFRNGSRLRPNPPLRRRGARLSNGAFGGSMQGSYRLRRKLAVILHADVAVSTALVQRNAGYSKLEGHRTLFANCVYKAQASQI